MIALGDYMDAQCHACIGGTNVRADIAKLELGQHIVVGTPGRVLDMIQRRALGGCLSVLPHKELTLAGPSVQIPEASKSSCWTRQTRCFPEVSRTRSTMCSGSFLPTHR